MPRATDQGIAASGGGRLPCLHQRGWPIVRQELHGACDQADDERDLPGEMASAKSEMGAHASPAGRFAT